MQYDESEGDPRHHLPRGHSPLTKERVAKGDIRHDGKAIRALLGSDSLTRLLHARVIEEGHHHTGRHFQEMWSLMTAPVRARTARLESQGGESRLDSFDYPRVWRALGKVHQPRIQWACFGSIPPSMMEQVYHRRGSYQLAFEALQQAIDDNRAMKARWKKDGIA